MTNKPDGLSGLGWCLLCGFTSPPPKNSGFYGYLPWRL